MIQRPAQIQNYELRREIRELRSELVKMEYDLQLTKDRNQILSREIGEITRLLNFSVMQCKMILKMRGGEVLLEGFSRSYHLLHRN